MISDGLGNVESRRDFMPFGEEISSTVGSRSQNFGYTLTGDNVRQKFTGYQKDEESQLDFAEARMYENRHGRFTAIDPLLASGKNSNPQTFNRYLYVMNNPHRFTDENGKWPTETHKKLIEYTFVGLTSQQITQIQNGSYSVDVGSHRRASLLNPVVASFTPKTLLPSEAFKHGMTPFGMTSDDARAAATSYLNDRLGEVQRLQKSFEEQGGKGLAMTALLVLGQATHVYEDMTSPAHGYDKEYKIPTKEVQLPLPGRSGSDDVPTITITVYDIEKWKKELEEHNEQEDSNNVQPTSRQKEQTALYGRAFFLLAFGEQKFEELTLTDEERKKARELAERYNPNLKRK